MKVYTDGSLTRIAYVFADEVETLSYTCCLLVEEATVNEAEYIALREALKEALGRGYREIEVYSDSQLMVKQLNGEYVTRSTRLLVLRNHVQALLERFGRATVTWIPRGANLAGHLLEEKS